MPEATTTAEKIELTEENQIDELLGSPPKWMTTVGYGTFIALIIIGILLTFIEYADTIPAPVQIYSEHPPVRVKSKKAGQIETIFVDNLNIVEKNTPLAKMETIAKWEDIRELKDFLAQAMTLPNHLQYANLVPPNDLALGEIRADYANFIEALSDYKYQLQQDNFDQIVASLAKQMSARQIYTGEIDQQIRFQKEQIALDSSNVVREDSLVAMGEGHTSQIEVEAAKKVLAQSKQQLEVLKNEKNQNDIFLKDLQSQSLEVKLRESNQTHISRLRCESQFQLLQASIEAWEEQNMLIAPIGGQVSMSIIWHEGQYVDMDTPVFTILPQEKESIIVGKAQVSPNRMGKLEVGSNALIHLDNYPQTEFGVIECEISNISLVPENGFYYVDLQIPFPIQTTYKEPITYQAELQGTAFIETKRRSLFHRILDRFKNERYNR